MPQSKPRNHERKTSNLDQEATVVEAYFKGISKALPK